jgi:Flp pilus assembly protein TadD
MERAGMSRRTRLAGGGKPGKGRQKPLGVGRRQAVRDPERTLQTAVDAINCGDFMGGLELAELVLQATGLDVAAEVAVHAALHLNPEAAVNALTRLAGLRPRDPGLLNDLGGMLCQLGQFDDAEKWFRQSLRLRPRHPPTLGNLGQALLGGRNFQAAETAFRECIELAPASASAYSGLGMALELAGEIASAIEAHRKAVKIEPDTRAYQDNLERALLQAGTGQAEREEMYRGYLKADPDDVATLLALGGAVYDQRRFGEAKAIFARVVDLQPTAKQLARARLALDQISFIEGDYETAWRDYAWRMQNGDIEVRGHPFPKWHGEALAGKTILLWEEQGLGECLMFLRFVPYLLEQGVRIVYETKPRFAPVVAEAFPEFEIMLVKEPPASVGRTDIDYQAALGDLGQWVWSEFHAREAAPEPRFRPKQAAAYRARYLAETGAGPETRLVGLAWRSVVSRLGPSKSLRLADLGALLRRPDTVFIDLQYGDTRDEIAKAEQAFGCRIYHDETFDQRTDLVSFFAQVAAVDAVISISNTTLHVAGSVGVPTAGLLSTVPMWRWEFDREASIWYPTVRLFRQVRNGDWSGPAQAAQAFIDKVMPG